MVLLFDSAVSNSCPGLLSAIGPKLYRQADRWKVFLFRHMVHSADNLDEDTIRDHKRLDRYFVSLISSICVSLGEIVWVCQAILLIDQSAVIYTSKDWLTFPVMLLDIFCRTLQRPKAKQVRSSTVIAAAGLDGPFPPSQRHHLLASEIWMVPPTFHKAKRFIYEGYQTWCLNHNERFSLCSSAVGFETRVGWKLSQTFKPKTMASSWSHVACFKTKPIYSLDSIVPWMPH